VNRARSTIDVRQFRRALLRWFRRHGRDLPWRRTRDPYAILVSEFMLQQTQVATVLPYYINWLRRFPNFRALAAATENDVLHAWQGLGYYSRARNLHATAKLVQDRHGGKLPNDPQLLRELPGIGRYTANAIATFAFARSVPIVEANTSRLLARLFNVTRDEKLWQIAATVVPKRNPARFNSALMDFGALICTARNPSCSICPAKKFCRAPDLKISKHKPSTKHSIEDHLFMANGDRIVLARCTGRWRNMWMLPQLKLDRLNRSSLRSSVYEAVFPFTNHRIRLRVFRRRQRKIDNASQRWFSRRQLTSIPIPSPHRRAIEQLFPAA
jgi:A/G-specific adenine glycosylase